MIYLQSFAKLHQPDAEIRKIYPLYLWHIFERYNQIANYAYTQSEINIKIKDDAPCDYMKPMLEQASGGDLVYGGITDIDDLKRNLAENCIPEGFENMDIWSYAIFLEERRILMAQYIREYYKKLD